MFKRTLAAACAASLAAFCGGQALAGNNDSTTLSGKTFMDLTHIDQKRDGDKTAASGTGVDVKRFYVGITHDFDSVWSVDVTTDFNYSSSDGTTQVYLKKAYLQAKIADALAVRLGSADLPWVPFVEDLYGYRYVENVLVDRLKFGTSADWGVNGSGQLAAGRIGYSLSVVNGNGYKNPTRSKGVDVEGRVDYSPLAGLTLAAGFYSGKLGKDVQGEAVRAFHTAQRFDALAAYVGAGWRAGAEYFRARNWNNVLTATSDTADGYSLWASYRFTPRWSVFARADSARISRDIVPGLRDRYYNAGVAYSPRGNIDVAFVIKRDNAEDGSVPTSNGVIGGLRDGTYTEGGVWIQVKF